MTTVILPDEIQSIVESEVQDGGYASAADYLSRLVRQDQKRRAKEELEAFVLEGIESGEEVEMTAQAWRNLRHELHRQAGIDE